MATNVQVKQAMVKYAIAHKLVVPRGYQASNPVWGAGAKQLAWGISGHAFGPGKAATGKTPQLVALLLPNAAPQFTIRHDYHAVHHSGTRPLSAIRLIVLHDMEATGGTTAAEGVGSYFEMQASGGSTQYGVDNDSIQQYLADNVIPWGAPYANTDGVHIEQMGVASWSEAQWKSKAAGTLERTAWLIAQLSRKLGIPIHTLTDAQVQSGQKGITTHAQCTRVFHVYGGHTDPGSHYPLAYVLGLAKQYV